jgi:hypothetical protein
MTPKSEAGKKTMFGKHQVGQKLAMTSDRLNLNEWKYLPCVLK